MSETEELSSTFELESIAQEELKKRAREKAARAQAASLQKLQESPDVTPVVEQPAEKHAPKPTPKSEVQPSIKKQTSKKPKRQTSSGDKTTRELVRKHTVERKALEKSISDLSKKRDRDVRDLMEKVLRDHYAQVDRERAEYVGVLSDLKKSLERRGRFGGIECNESQRQR